MRTKITKRNVKSVANQIVKAMENATEGYGLVIKRESFSQSECITLTCPDMFIPLDVVARVMKHICYFEDIYRTIIMGIVVAMDDDGIRHPAIEVELIF